MKKAGLVLLVLIVMSLGTGCVSQVHNQDITVTSPDIDNPEPVNAGSVDMYTPQFRITNPSNRTFTNIRVRIDVIPSLSYCHSLSKEIGIPALYPGQKRIELVSIAEFSNIDCQYSFTSDVTSDP
ncbi:hypothetical protein [uncultured Methanoregula sp.]|uniref:hypothetical protein n=1 Tax=uncultured Methanoregula sp. TaxID=1005933 RepID=UPI002AAAE9FD|nr:hypothetical protein [uncultured Methanoregula sp.]